MIVLSLAKEEVVDEVKTRRVNLAASALSLLIIITEYP